MREDTLYNELKTMAAPRRGVTPEWRNFGERSEILSKLAFTQLGISRTGRDRFWNIIGFSS
jgi:hypothetical protein